MEKDNLEQKKINDTKTINVNVNEIYSVEDENDGGVPMKKNKKVKPSGEKLGFNWVLWICILIIAIPSIIFAYILFSAASDTGVPLTGNRFVGDLEPAITEENIGAIEASIKEISGVESVTVDLKVATMRISIDVDDTLASNDISTITLDAYAKVDAIIPIAEYFTETETKKQYDLEISVYNNIEKEDGFIMFSVIKNSGMKDYKLQDVSTPLNAELAEELLENIKKRDEEAAKEEEQTDESTETTEADSQQGEQ